MSTTPTVHPRWVCDAVAGITHEVDKRLIEPLVVVCKPVGEKPLSPEDDGAVARPKDNGDRR